MIKADAFIVAGIGSAADSRLQGITRALVKTYLPPQEDGLPERLAELIARLRLSEAGAVDQK